jgi:uncharacterized protein
MDVITRWEGASKSPPGLVLDTNAVLDWLVFGDPGMTEVAAAIRSRDVRWLVCSRMRDELARTLAYVDLAKWQPDTAKVLANFDLYAEMQSAPTPGQPSQRCTDPDDQVFIDLALASGARWLLTRDRALLALAPWAKKAGVLVVNPAEFANLFST